MPQQVQVPDTAVPAFLIDTPIDTTPATQAAPARKAGRPRADRGRPNSRREERMLILLPLVLGNPNIGPQEVAGLMQVSPATAAGDLAIARERLLQAGKISRDDSGRYSKVIV